MNASRICSALFALAVLGCAQPQDPNVPELDSLWATGATVGDTGKLRLVLRSPAAADVPVALSLVDTALAAVPSTATIESGARWVEVDFTASRLGTTVLTAAVGDSRLSTTISVVPAITLSSSSAGTLRVQKGASTVLYVYFTAVLPEPATLEIDHGTAGIIDAPASVVAPAFSSSAMLPIKALAAGSSAVTVTWGGTTVRYPIYVTDSIALGYSYASPARTLVGTPSRLYLELSAVPAGEVLVTVRSSNPAVVPDPAPSGFRMTSQWAYLPFTPIAAGNTQLIVELGASSRMTNFAAVASNGVSGLTCSSGVVLVAGGTAECAVTLAAAAPADTTVMLDTSEPSLFELPSSVIVPAGQESAAFTLEARGTGMGIVTATMGSSKRSISLTAGVGAGPLSQLYTSTSPVVGQPLTLYLYLAYSPELTVSLTSSNPAVLPLPASITIPAFTGAVAIAAPVLASGVTVVTASVGASKVTLVLYVPAVSDFSANLSSTPWEVGYAEDLRLYTSQAPAVDLPVTITSSVPGVVDVATEASFRAGTSQLRIPVRALAPGTTLLRATVGQETFGFTVRVVSEAKLVGLTGSGIATTHSGALNVVLDALVAHDTLVTLSQSGAGAMQLPGNVTVPTGTAGVSLGVMGVTAGAVNVTATTPGSSVSATITIGT